MARARSLSTLKKAAQTCRACPLFERATQTVFGEGPARATVMLVGEQPGDAEDIEGRPFVGPAGRMLERALAEAGLERRDVYVTNAVKHFKWVARGKRRIHERPSASEIAACQDWLLGEIQAVRPKVVVALGAVAGRSLFGSTFRLLAERGRERALEGGAIGLGTRHPSAILRMPDAARRKEGYAELVADLTLARRIAARRYVARDFSPAPRLFSLSAFLPAARTGRSAQRCRRAPAAGESLAFRHETPG